jgi:hypothetical protein
MSTWPLWAWSLEKLARPQFLLAVAGGAAIGGLLTGFLVKVIVKATTTQTMPRGLVNVFRVLGGLICGWLVFLLMQGVGDGWGGGPGGEGNGSGSTNIPVSTDKNTKPPPEKDKDKDKGTPERQGSLYVEVLNNDEIEAAMGPGAVASGRYYHIKGEEMKNLLTLSEVKEKIKGQKKPPENLYIVTGPNRPDRTVPRVKDLDTWARRQGIEVAYQAP